MPLLSRLTIAWILGIALARWLNLPWPVIAVASLPALGALFLYRRTPHLQIGAALALALAAGAFRLSFFQPVFDKTVVSLNYVDEKKPLDVVVNWLV